MGRRSRHVFDSDCEVCGGNRFLSLTPARGAWQLKCEQCGMTRPHYRQQRPSTKPRPAPAPDPVPEAIPAQLLERGFPVSGFTAFERLYPTRPDGSLDPRDHRRAVLIRHLGQTRSGVG